MFSKECFQKSPFLRISTFDSVFETLHFCGVFLQINVNTFTKTEAFLSVFVQKRCSVNGALKSGDNLKTKRDLKVKNSKQDSPSFDSAVQDRYQLCLRRGGEKPKFSDEKTINNNSNNNSCTDLTPR